MAAACDLNAAKKNLQESLGESMKLYLQNLKSWFKQKISKEDFDLEARKLLSDEAVHLHNEFLLAIIARCQSLSSSLVPKESSILGKSSDQARQTKLLKQKSRKRPPSSRNIFQQRFVPANPVIHAPEAIYKGADDIVFAARELSLPDITMVHGRMLVCAWESGLDDVSDTAVKLVMQSIENQLKNLISLVLSRRNGYKLREKKFKFAVGTQIKNPYLRHSYMLEDESIESEATMISQTGNHIPSRKPSIEIGEGVAAEQLATAGHPTYKGPVSLYDLLQALQLYRSAIPSHTVYSVAMEHIIHRLWHPSHEEINQDLIQKQEVALKQQISASSSTQATGHYSSTHRTKHHEGHHSKHHHHHHHRSDHHSGHHHKSNHHKSEHQSSGHHHHHKSESGHHHKSDHVKTEHVKSEHHHKSEHQATANNKTEHRSSGHHQQIEHQPALGHIKLEHMSPVHVKLENQAPGQQRSELQMTGEHLTLEHQSLLGQQLSGFTNVKLEQSIQPPQTSHHGKTESQGGQHHKTSQSLQHSSGQQMAVHHSSQLIPSDDQMDFDDDSSLDNQLTSQLSSGHGLVRQTSLDQSLSDFFSGQFSDIR